MPKVKNKPINLIPQDEFETSIFGRGLKWALSSFRVMVIVTELVVMSAFLSRFWLDAKNSDLNEELKTKQAQISAYEEVESEFRKIQKKLSTAKLLYDEFKTTKILSELETNLPAEVTLNTLTVNFPSISIKASSTSENKIAQMLRNLENNKSFSKIVLSQIVSDQENSQMIVFTIDGEIKK